MKIKKNYSLKILGLLSILVVMSALIESIFFDKITVLAFIIALILLGSKERAFVNPYYLFVLTPFSLLIYNNVIDRYMLDLTHNTYLLAIINIMAFIVALSLGPVIKIKKTYKSKSDSKWSLRLKIFVLFSLSFVGFFVPFLHSIFWLFSIPAIVIALKSKEIKLVLVVLGYILFVASISLSKTALLLYILTFVVSLNKYYVFSGKRAIWLKVFSVCGIVFLIYAFSFANKDRGLYDAEEGLEYFGREGHSWEFDATLFLPYMYLTTPWTNLQYVTESQDSRTYGLWVIKPFVNYFQLDESFEREYTITPYSNFNTFTFISVGFKDFGFWFSTLSSLMLGFFVKKVYVRYLVSFSPFDTATYAIFALATVQMFFSNHFFMVSYPFTMLIVMWLTKFFVYK